MGPGGLSLLLHPLRDLLSVSSLKPRQPRRQRPPPLPCGGPRKRQPGTSAPRHGASPVAAGEGAPDAASSRQSASCARRNPSCCGSSARRHSGAVPHPLLLLRLMAPPPGPLSLIFPFAQAIQREMLEAHGARTAVATQASLRCRRGFWRPYPLASTSLCHVLPSLLSAASSLDRRRKYKQRYLRNRPRSIYRESRHRRCPRPRSQERICPSTWIISLVRSRKLSN